MTSARRYVILGGGGQLGRALASRLGPSALALGRADADVTIRHRPERHHETDRSGPRRIVGLAVGGPQLGDLKCRSIAKRHRLPGPVGCKRGDPASGRSAGDRLEDPGRKAGRGELHPG